MAVKAVEATYWGEVPQGSRGDQMTLRTEFCLLGPLLVRHDEVVVPVPAGKQQAVLACLLLSANRVVRRADIAEALWGPRPPPSAQVTVRNYVRRLRHTLEVTGGARIRTVPHGYLISVAAGELDVARFEALAEAAAAAARDDQWGDAAASARAALELWRGEPLADVESEALVRREVPRLSEMRLQVLHARLDADLRLGRHADVVAELGQLATAYPLREHLRALLMLALYRCGRQADALAVYQQARQALVEEIGTEPGAELREIHRRILTGDPSVAAPDSAPLLQDTGHRGDLAAETRLITQLSDEAGAVPRQLPAAARHFTGRQDELETLVGVLGATGSDTVVMSAINGMAGVGKTALAVQAAHRLSGQFPGGQLFIDLHGYSRAREPRTPGDALDWLLRALGVPAGRVPQDAEERAALYRQRLAGTRTLVVLDNAASEGQVRPLLPGSPGCVVLVTSRRRLKGLDEAHLLALDVLPLADAVALVRVVAGRGRVAADDPVLAEIAGLCGRLPLALRIAAALLSHRPAWPPGHLAGLLRDQRQRLGILSDGERDLGTAFGLSYRSLPGPAQRLFRSLWLVPGADFDAYAIAALTGTDPATATRLLEDLVDHNLLIQQAAGRYRLPDLIRLHVRALARYDRVRSRGRTGPWSNAWDRPAP